MPPVVALVAITGCVAGALIIDSRREPRVSLALWIPLLWFLVLASRPVTQWFNPGAGSLSVTLEDGSPIDRNLLSALMVLAGVILIGRRPQWLRWLRENPWLVLFFVYCGISIAWSDFPAVALKRWIRALGSVMMILVVLTEKDPVAAVATLVRRCAYVLVPLSIVLIKYYRQQAVAYNYWTGEEILVGVTTDKNALGRLCLISGLFAVWELVTIRHNLHIHRDRINRLVSLTVFAMTLWLLMLSNSATSLAAFLLGCSIIWALGIPVLKKQARHLGIIASVAVTVAVAVGLSLNLAEVLVEGLGRDLTFTDRTFIWHDLMNMGTNPLVGVGYDSFWLGQRLERFVTVHRVNEAHNGYLEVYLELGTLGLLLLSGFVLSTFRSAKRSLVSDAEYGRLRMAILAVFLVYNLTEAGYKATTSIFFVFLLVAIACPARPTSTAVVRAVARRPWRHAPRARGVDTAAVGRLRKVGGSSWRMRA